MSKKIVKQGSGNLSTIKKNLDILKHESRKLGKQIETIIKEETHEEKKAYERALKKYTDKMNQVLQQGEIKTKLEAKYKCENKIYTIFERVQKTYKKAVKTIMSQPITKEEKHEKIIKLQNKIQAALINDDDKKILAIISGQLRNLPYKNIKLLC